MASLSGFNAANIQPAQPLNFDPIPAGEYLGHITESEIAPLNSGNGNGLKLTFEVIDGQHKGRRIWEMLSIVHTNPKTQQIAQEQLSAICHAIGIMQPQDSAELHHKPILLTVAIRPADGQYKAKNIIKGYSKASGAPVAAARPNPAPFQPAPAAATAPAANAVPWATRASA
jgi:hypothetical protein